MRPYEDSRTPEQIRNDIDATRAALDRTVTEIEHRLQPRHMYEEAKTAAANRVRQAAESARDAARRTAEQAVAFGYRTADRVKESPGASLAAALGCVAATLATFWGVQQLRRRGVMRRRSIAPPMRAVPATSNTMRSRRPNRWRRPTLVGAAAAALGACGTYAARARR